MTVLLECKLNLAQEFIARAGYKQHDVKELRRIKMNEFVLPGSIIRCEVKVKQHDENELILSYRSDVDGKRVCVLEIVLSPKG